MSVIPKTKDQVDQWRSVMFLYDSALKKLNTKIEILNNEFVNRYDHNPIEHIKSRLKTADSIVKKLKKDGYEVTIENMMDHLSDIAGIRIICSFTSDIYQIADMIAAQGDITVLHVKDYIQNPKPNGYKSYHMVVTVPVYLADGPVQTKVEIQIRSVAMDFWASLEHKIAYKFEGNAPEGLLRELKECADVVDMLDKKMFSLNEAITAYAKEHPEEEVVFLSVGFETTTPAGCLSVKKAEEEGITNYSMLIANKTMPQAYEALKGSADIFLYPGHVNAITGTKLCEELVQEDVSGVVAGFTAKELLTALAVALTHFQKGKPFFVNCYPRVVTEEGSKEAQRLVDTLMEACDSEWRGLGIIPGSGLRLRDEWGMYDARKKYQVPKMEGRANPACRCGDVLQGKCKPSDCKVFGKVCTPQHPVGACMVSGEGACSAYYMYGRE
jgi:hydrogenase expression/formation protein HypD